MTPPLRRLGDTEKGLDHQKPHPALVRLCLGIGGFTIGTTEFATMSLLRCFAHDLIDTSPPPDESSARTRSV